jgi:hypothetical protein
VKKKLIVAIAIVLTLATSGGGWTWDDGVEISATVVSVAGDG